MEITNTKGFNPRTPCGVRPLTLPGRQMYSSVFQSTHSLRSATPAYVLNQLVTAVSIHALLAECDQWEGYVAIDDNGFQSTHSLRSATIIGVLPCQGPAGFNPRTPCGVRLQPTEVNLLACWFQSTHSLRSATLQQIHQFFFRVVSIHALLAECDSRTRPG